MKIRVKPGNLVRYSQEMDFHVGLPAGVMFDVEVLNKGTTGLKFKLTADGYGKHGKEGDYGNGALYMYFNDMSDEDKANISVKMASEVILKDLTNAALNCN